MDFAGYTPFPDKELGGLANYDDESQIPQGLATVVRNTRFRKRSPRTRDGYLHTMSYVPPAIAAETTIQSVKTVFSLQHLQLSAIALVGSSQGFTVGSQITVAGCSNPIFDGTWTLTGVSPNSLLWNIGANGTGTGGTATQTAVGAVDMTGVEALDVLVNNPQQRVIASDSNGDLLEESPVGSGELAPLSTPFTLPIGVSMQTSKAYNRIYCAFSNLMNALAPPMVLDGPTNVVAPVSQNPIGAIWTPGRNYLPGDVVRTSANPNRWFSCVLGGLAGAIEPTWPTLDGYMAPQTLSVQIINIELETGTAYCVVASSVGLQVGDSVTVAGSSNPAFDGTFILTNVFTGEVEWAQLGNETATGGTLTATTPVSSFPAQVTDPNGVSQWIEWTPGAVQFLPQPEAPELCISIKGQAGAPTGSIAAGQDVYFCFAYQNANGESQWTAPAAYANGVAADVLEIFFQQPGEVPGPATAAAYGAAGYGGPRMPQWLMSVLGASHPRISWPTLNCLNVYVAAVAHGAPAPQTYYQYASGAPCYEPVVISSIPTTGSLFAPRSTPNAGLTTLPFIGASGPRWLAVERIDLNDSLVPIDPGSPMQFTFLSSIAASGQANITFIQRTAAGIVTCTVDSLAGFNQGSQVIIAGVDDDSFNGTFTLTGVAPNQYGGATLLWTQTSSPALPASASGGGTATSASAASAFVTPQDLITNISRVSNVVTATVNSIQGLAIGTAVSVAGVVSDPSFNSPAGTSFILIAPFTPNLGGGGTITWDQTGADSSSSGTGVVSPTGAGTGTNAPQPVTEMWRSEYPVKAGYVYALMEANGTPEPPPPGFVVGAQIAVANMSDPSLDGTFQILAVAQNNAVQNGAGGGWYMIWLQAGAGTSGTGGNVTLVSGSGPTQAQGNITAIARAGGVVTATLDSTANFIQGAEVQVTAVPDGTYDGTFFLTSVSSTQLQWNQPGPNSSSTGGEVIQTSGGTQQPTPVAILPPGGVFIAEDIAAWSVEGAVQAGPFTFLPAQDPVTPFSASIQSIGVIDGAVTALLSSTSGLLAGNTIQVKGTPNGWFDGIFVLAEVAGNTVEWAGVGPGTGYAGGTVSLVPTQPTDAMGQNNPVAITSIQGFASGIVSAQIADVSNLEAGMCIQVQNVPVASFNGQFVVLSVNANQLPGSTTPLAGTATWQSSTTSVESATGGGYLVGLPGIILDAIDNDLADGDDVTPQLSTIPAPSCTNIYFAEQLNMMVYTIGQDSAHYFSNPGDPANIVSPGGILGVAESNGQRTRGIVETISGEIVSLKEKSGYEVTPGSSTPSQWGVSRRWFGHGPCGPRAWDTADDFIVYFDEDSGLYRYHNGQAMQVGQELQGTWDLINKLASAQVCVCVDNIRKEVHIGIPLGTSLVPTVDVVCNYFNGWEEPLMLTMTGEMMPNPRGRRWAVNDGATGGANFRFIKILDRKLASPPSPLIVKRQMVFCLAGSTGAPAYIDMSVPEQMNDNGLAINCQYQPSFAQSPTLETLVWDKMKLRALGLGALAPLCIQPITEDPAKSAAIAAVTVNLSDGLADSRQKAFSQVVTELFTVLYSNQDPGTGLPIANAGFELHRSVRYGKIRTSGTPEG
jgi:hypothetical protein